MDAGIGCWDAGKLDGGWTAACNSRGNIGSEPESGSKSSFHKSHSWAKMYSFWDVFNFSLKSLSDVVPLYIFLFPFLFFALSASAFPPAAGCSSRLLCVCLR